MFQFNWFRAPDIAASLDLPCQTFVGFAVTRINYTATVIPRTRVQVRSQPWALTPTRMENPNWYPNRQSPSRFVPPCPIVFSSYHVPSALRPGNMAAKVGHLGSAVAGTGLSRRYRAGEPRSRLWRGREPALFPVHLYGSLVNMGERIDQVREQLSINFSEIEAGMSSWWDPVVDSVNRARVRVESLLRESLQPLVLATSEPTRLLLDDYIPDIDTVDERIYSLPAALTDALQSVGRRSPDRWDYCNGITDHTVRKISRELFRRGVKELAVRTESYRSTTTVSREVHDTFTVQTKLWSLNDLEHWQLERLVVTYPHAVDSQVSDLLALSNAEEAPIWEKRADRW